jgi:hypothetical protein
MNYILKISDSLAAVVEIITTQADKGGERGTTGSFFSTSPNTAVIGSTGWGQV